MKRKRLATGVLLVLLLCRPVFSQNDIEDFELIVRNGGVRVSSELTVDTVLVAFATPLMQVSDYWRRSIDSFKGRMDEIGLPYDIYEYSTKVDEHRKLRESIQAARLTNPDYIVVTLNEPGDELLISRLLVHETPKVIIQNVTRPVKEWRETPPFLYVGFDHSTGAERLADEYIRRFRGFDDVKYAMMYHLEGNHVSRYRGDHFIRIIDDKTDFKLVAEYYTQGDRESSRAAAVKILDRNEDLDFIYACATDIAFGIIDALKDTGRFGEVAVNGWGGGSRELESIIAGELDFTVMRMNDDNGVAMAEAIRLDLQSKNSPLVYSGDMLIITKEDDPEYIDELKVRSFRYSGE